MILGIPSLISGYEITECTGIDDANICETYKGKNIQQKPVIIVAYNMKVLERSSSKEAYLQELSCRKVLYSPSFLPILEEISIKSKGRNILMMVFKTLPSMMPLDEKLRLGCIKKEDAWSVIMDIIIGIREVSYKSKGISQLALDSNTIYVYLDKRDNLRGIISSFLHTDKSWQFSLALLITKIIKGTHLQLPLDDSAALQNRTSKHKKDNCSQGDLARCIRKALDSNPNKRYLSVEEFIKALIHFCPFRMPTTFECFGRA